MSDKNKQNKPDLPAPHPDALAHSNKCRDFLRGYIDDQGGVVPFQDFMQQALYAPGLGYYVAGTEKIGDSGDFITAPEISSVFSRCVANAMQPVLRELASPVIYEFGAGRGRMAADIIRYYLDRQVALSSYCIIEVSPDLIARQQALLEREVPEFINNIIWLSALPDEIQGVLLANEVMDAMPVSIFRKQDNDSSEHAREYACELGVGVMQDEFVLAQCRQPNERLQYRVDQIEKELAASFAAGYVSEVNFIAEDWIRELYGCIDKGAVLLIDYGYPRHEYYHAQRQQGTLMCHYQHHAHTDPFVYPGIQDITAHVDFTAIADAATKAGFKLDGYTTQANFLLANRFDEIVQSQTDGSAEDMIRVSRAVQKLVMPHEMGELFKVMGLSKNLGVSINGFAQQDLSHKL